MAAIFVQLVLLLALSQMFRIETWAFRKVLALVAVGFVIHHLLPLTWRMSFFVLLSLGSLALVLGPTHAARLLGVGVLLLTLCHLPIRLTLRLLLIGLTTAALVAGRANFGFPLPSYDVVWPILGSMFMFRLIIYLVDLRNDSAPFDVRRALAYFFMLPNVCFPMYPLVDYQTFCRTYYDEPTPWRTYQVGVKWILRGFIHLLLYRLISQNLLIAPEHVLDAGTLVRYMITTYSLYLLISGQFHVIVGMLHLFGFNLPETHHLYFLSSSFTDFWRRINIYWKDFVLKVFFNPVYFRVKSLGPVMAMSLATLVAFFFTWLLHSYQRFWIRGDYPMTLQDALFWGSLALLVLVNALIEQRYGRTRKLRGQRWTLQERTLVGLKTIGTFSVLTTLWCLWTFQGTLREWVSFMGHIGRMDAAAAWSIGGLLMGIGLTAGLMANVGREYSAGQRAERQSPQEGNSGFHFWTSAAVATALMLTALAAGRFHNRLPLNDTARLIMADLRSDFTLQARIDRERGYYEDLTSTKDYNLALWELYNQKVDFLQQHGLHETEAAVLLPGQFHQMELLPQRQVTFRGSLLTTNRWGMRDRDYEMDKPAGVHRTLLFGSSVSMGWGVMDDKVYENVLEDRLNREHAGSTDRRFEVLNFSVPGYKALQKLWAFERGLEFEPDAVLVAVHASEFDWLAGHLSQVIERGVEIPYPELRDWLQREGIQSGSSRLAVRAKLNQMAPQLVVWTWRRMKQQCDERGIQFQLLLKPRLDSVRRDEQIYAQLRELAKTSGLTLLDLTDAYDVAPNVGSLRIALRDEHPNAEGHRLLAEKLHQQMLTSPYWLDVLGSSRQIGGRNAP